ncbi:hypothetical protein FRB94_007102 [Tulasnella sp. JGI-2019a]|nr:hypothetical protein FRB94_007102 [Tulasnella sp. JGI-2019a]
MVHVPPTTTVPTRRRGRPPKHRSSNPIIPVTATAGQGPATDVPQPTFITSLSFKLNQPKRSVNSLDESSAPPSPQKRETPAPTPPPEPTPSPAAINNNPPPLYEIMRGRAPRKSKIDAMAAISARSVSPTENMTRGTGPSPSSINSGTASTSGQRTNAAADSVNKTPIRPPLPEAPPIDLASVKTPKRQIDPPREHERPFGIEDCPAFYPTMEEFADPMAYVKSISEEARKYGICKIVPPKGWDMPFVIDTKTFRFKTRLQRLNSIEASSRAKLNFLEQLYRFHQQQEQVGPVVPTINHKSLDLWLLRKEVTSKGGYEIVSRTKQWGEVARLLGYEGIVGVSSQLKNAYARIILPFEQFSDHIRNSPSMAALSPMTTKIIDNQTSRMRMAGTTHLAPSRMANGRMGSGGFRPTLASSSQTRQSSVTSSGLSEPPEEAERKPSVHPEITIRVSGPQDDADLSTSGGTKTPNASSTPLPQMSSTAPNHRDSAYVQGDTCEVCHSGDRGTHMLLCDGCDKGYHTFCLDPPLPGIPKGQWFCHICLFDTGGDYGFDEGEEHSLHSFQQRDLAFRRAWFESHPPEARDWQDPRSYRLGDVDISEDDVEKEFWRLVESPLETVEIEYGADVHSTTHGSASPSLETHPLDPYSRHGWNVNNMPIVSDSLLRYVKSDISGMTVPWIYVGMVFSTFCWHNEDHYTYSVNYMHWGETKTWYGVPGDDAEKFEAAIKSEAPDLFDAQPDLLFQLVTLMSPKRLREANVRVYGCNQRPGEYVITFPKAYHAGFNHGMNLNEAVNFAVPDWINDGRDCVKRYQEHQKLPVFSHDELLITITQHSPTIKTAVWVLNSLREMVDNQIGLRDRMRNDVPSLTEITDEDDRPEEQYQCAVCKGFTYLAQVTCHCTKQVSCLEHWTNLCDCSASNRTLRKRFDDEQLRNILHSVEDRAQAPQAWRERLKKLLSAEHTPSIHELTALLDDAQEMVSELEEYSNLRRYVDKAEQLRRQVRNMLEPRVPPKYQRVLPRKPNAPLNHSQLLIAHAQYTPEDVNLLIREIKEFAFQCEELVELEKVLAWANDWDKVAQHCLDARKEAGGEKEPDRIIWEDIYAKAFTRNIQVKLLDQVAIMVQRARLLEEFRDVEDRALTLDDVKTFQQYATMCGISPAMDECVRLRQRIERGENWCSETRKVLSQPVRSIDSLNALVTPPVTVPISPSLLERVDAIRARARELEKRARLMISPPVGRRVTIHEAVQLAEIAQKEFIIPTVTMLLELASMAARFESRCADISVARYQTSKPVFEELRDMRATVQTKLWMFSMPYFQTVDHQLVAHDAWLERLPWYGMPEPATKGTEIADDVMEYTRQDDDAPPLDPECTCICRLPVKVTVERQADAVQCDHCGAKFHGKCIEGSCPFCDHHHWNGSIVKPRSFQFHELIPVAREAPTLTRNYSLAWKHLDTIITHVDRLTRSIEGFLAVVSEPSGPVPLGAAIAQIRHYMRKLYKMQFNVQPRPDLPSYGITLCHLHRTLATTKLQMNGTGSSSTTLPKKKTNRRPKFIFTAEMAQPAVDGTRCLCLGSHTGHRQISCTACSQRFHGVCVAYDELRAPTGKPWRCPMCVVKKGKDYPCSAVRVRFQGDGDPDLYIDTKACIDNYSSKIIRCRLPPPTQPTIIVEMQRYSPGSNHCPDSVTATPPPMSNGTSKSDNPIPKGENGQVKLRPREPSPEDDPVILSMEPLQPTGKRKASHSPPRDAARKIKLVIRHHGERDENGDFKLPA